MLALLSFLRINSRSCWVFFKPSLYMMLAIWNQECFYEVIEKLKLTFYGMALSLQIQISITFSKTVKKNFQTSKNLWNILFLDLQLILTRTRRSIFLIINFTYQIMIIFDTSSLQTHKDFGKIATKTWWTL